MSKKHQLVTTSGLRARQEVSRAIQANLHAPQVPRRRTNQYNQYR